MEFLRDDGLAFCSFFDISEISEKRSNSRDSEKNRVYLNDTKENEKIMILYTKEKMQKTTA